MFQLDFGNDGLLTGALIYGAVVLLAVWLAMIVWTYRDMRARSRDGIAQVGAAAMVALLTFPGLILYIFLRPRETLSEAYERSLEEEALLQEIEEKPSCPGCRQRIQPEWQVCPHCHTSLKKTCVRCSRLLDLTWDLCPYCASAQPGYSTEITVSAPQPSRAAESTRSMASPRRRATRSESAIEFVDGDEA
jgi:RNA polymerase subunit RPABC4/transcription elongation factor Spt4